MPRRATCEFDSMEWNDSLHGAIGGILFGGMVIFALALMPAALARAPHAWGWVVGMSGALTALTVWAFVCTCLRFIRYSLQKEDKLVFCEDRLELVSSSGKVVVTLPRKEVVSVMLTGTSSWNFFFPFLGNGVAAGPLTTVVEFVLEAQIFFAKIRRRRARDFAEQVGEVWGLDVSTRSCGRAFWNKLIGRPPDNLKPVNIYYLNRPTLRSRIRGFFCRRGTGGGGQPEAQIQEGEQKRKGF